eukprot:4231812-Pyramimonas_sp.AAC.1
MRPRSAVFGKGGRMRAVWAVRGAPYGATKRCTGWEVGRMRAVALEAFGGAGPRNVVLGG